MLNSPIAQKINEYHKWRSSLTKTISDYRDWLASSQQSDAIRELRLYEILESLNRDQIVVVFLADESRGKTEMINALFFADFKQRLLPSESGRHSLCSSEIFWSPHDEPSIRLLPITTRKTEDSLTYLKTTANVWQKFRLNVHSPSDMNAVLRKLTEEIEVTQDEAEALGLWDPTNAAMVKELKITGSVKVPAWRHAMINYPHPLLQAGLVIVDTPGAEIMNSEPELTLDVIMGSHATVFVTATDTGVTRSDTGIWQEFVKGRSRYKTVALNKIDILADDHKTSQQIANEIERQINITAHQLNVSPDIVYPVSAQKALIGRIREIPELVEVSRINELEEALGNAIIKAKQEALGENAAIECGEMIKSSRKFIQYRLQNLREQVIELKSLSGKNIEESKIIINNVAVEKKRYEVSIPTFNKANEKISEHGKILLKHLSPAHLEKAIAESRQAMGDSWTTVGLNRSMRNLMQDAIELASTVTKESKKIKKLADDIYEEFHTKHGFAKFKAPELDMSNFLNNMRALEKITDDFCKDPINVLTEKHFLIRRFFLGLGVQKQKIFEQARLECKRWILDVLGTLKIQMAEHKTTLNERTQNLMKAKTSAESLAHQLHLIETEYQQAYKEALAIDGMLLHLIMATKPALQAKKAAKHGFTTEGMLQMPDLPFLDSPHGKPPTTPAN